MIIDPVEIRKWLHANGIYKGFTVVNGIVHGNENIEIKSGIIPFQFGTINGHFSVVAKDVPLGFKGFPHHINGHLGIYDSNIVNLSGIHKVIKYIGHTVVCRPDVTHVLGLLMIDGIKKIDSDRDKIDEILNKYLPTQDVIMAQDELIDAGFIEQAKL